VLAQQYGDQAAQNESDIGAIIRGRAAANDRTREGALNMALQGGAPIDVARMRGALAVETPSQTSEANKLAAIVSPAPVPGSAAVPGTESTPPMPDFNIPASDVYNPDTAGPSRDQISQEALRNRAAAWTPAPDASPEMTPAQMATLAERKREFDEKMKRPPAGTKPPATYDQLELAITKGLRPTYQPKVAKGTMEPEDVEVMTRFDAARRLVNNAAFQKTAAPIVELGKELRGASDPGAAALVVDKYSTALNANPAARAKNPAFAAIVDDLVARKSAPTWSSRWFGSGADTLTIPH
jgi:hypothetical protein